MGKEKYTQKTISVSKNGKKKIEGRKNRKGQVYKQTQTLHLGNS